MGVHSPRPTPFPLRRLITYVLVAAFAMGALIGGHDATPAPSAAHEPEPARA